MEKLGEMTAMGGLSALTKHLTDKQFVEYMTMIDYALCTASSSDADPLQHLDDLAEVYISVGRASADRRREFVNDGIIDLINHAFDELARLKHTYDEPNQRKWIRDRNGTKYPALTKALEYYNGIRTMTKEDSDKILYR